MKKFTLAFALGLFVPALGFTGYRSLSSTDPAPAPSAVAQPNQWCVLGTGAPCPEAAFASPRDNRQFVVLPAGYADEEYSKFRADFDRYVSAMSNLGGSIYSTSYKDSMVYLGYWLPGGALGTPESNFGAKIFKHPVRGKALTLNQESVMKVVDVLPDLTNRRARPIGVMVLYNSDEGIDASGHMVVTPNAATPTFLGREYGIARITRSFLNDSNDTAAHEMAHASMNWVDEYVESGFDSMSITTLDLLTPEALLGHGWGSWIQAMDARLGLYTYRLSDILAANGADNVDVSKYPSRVATAGYTPNPYETEGGMFFGKGTWHDQGSNLMDGRSTHHSDSQLGIIKQVFDPSHPVARPNDRIRAAGPVGFWRLKLGSDTHVMMFDADKTHRWHPTSGYELEVGWYERHWKVCRALKFIPYPCHTDQWTVARKNVAPVRKVLSLKPSRLFKLAGTVQWLACHLGLHQIKSGKGAIQLCEMPVDQMADSFLPTLDFPMPYEDAEVPASQWFTQYYWRFRTQNGAFTSGFTGWSGFYRTL